MLLVTTLPVVSTLPVVVTDARVPTEVMFGCAAVVTVPAVVAVVADKAEPEILPTIVSVTVNPDDAIQKMSPQKKLLWFSAKSIQTSKPYLELFAFFLL